MSLFGAGVYMSMRNPGDLHNTRAHTFFLLTKLQQFWNGTRQSWDPSTLSEYTTASSPVKDRGRSRRRRRHLHALSWMQQMRVHRNTQERERECVCVFTPPPPHLYKLRKSPKLIRSLRLL